MLDLWGHLLESDTLQFGFKSEVSTTQCSWLVMEVVNYYQRKGTPVLATLLDCSKAFDKCLFDVLFQKLIDKGMPAIVVRVLIFVYEEQKGSIRLAGVNSLEFSITNGTRQDSVLSPVLFGLYSDDLLKQLRQAGVGCHVGGVWMGATGYADDLILLSPSRESMATMLRICQEYGQKNNLVFSTDPNPKKSKTKCMYFCGRSGNSQYPVELTLDGKPLPWVPVATHLGHELHQSGSMDHDIRVKRARFIGDSTEIRETFKFGDIDQVLSAVRLYWPLLWIHFMVLEQ